MLNCRGLDSRSRIDAVVAALDALPEGGSLVAELDAPAGDVLQQLQAARPTQFEWSPLSAEPGGWRVQIDRRRATPRRGVNEALAWDHDRLDALEKLAFERRASGAYPGARETFAAFAHGLRRHIRFEEELVFPEFDARSGIPADAGPTAVMRAEHRQILDLLGGIEASIGEPSPVADGLRVELHAALTGHNNKEEQVLYPFVDRLLGEAESDSLVSKIQAL